MTIKSVMPKPKGSSGPLNRYRLTAGVHVDRDYDYQFGKDEIEAAEEAGRTLRYPPKHYKAGDVIESDKDLVKLLGGNRVQLLGPSKKNKGIQSRSEMGEDSPGNAFGEGQVSDPTPQNLDSGFAHPAGQVNTGFQATGGKDAFGNTISGVISKDELEERGLLPPELPDKSDKHKAAAEEGVKKKVHAKPATTLVRHDEDEEDVPEENHAKNHSSTKSTVHKSKPSSESKK